MREIKFRAWDSTAKKMLYVWQSSMPYDPDSLELMQFIGVRDVYWVEVYEGDIVRHIMPKEPGGTHDSFTGVIEYVDCCASFRTVVQSTGREEPIHQDVELCVIGNVQQNPELLKS